MPVSGDELQLRNQKLGRGDAPNIKVMCSTKLNRNVNERTPERFIATVTELLCTEN